MIMKRVLLIICLFLTGIGFAQSEEEILGHWYTGNNGSVVQMFKEGGKYYGKLSWVKPGEESKTDLNNPEKSLRSTPIMDVKFIRGLEWDASEKEYINGTVYNIQDGNSYDCYVELEGKNTLELRGFIKLRMFGETKEFTRLTEEELAEKGLK